MAVQINMKELGELLKLASQKIENLEANIQIDMDSYKIIGSDEWDHFDTDTIPDIGSLKDDWESLQKLLIEKSRPLTMVDLDRISTVLRAVSEYFSPISPNKKSDTDF